MSTIIENIPQDNFDLIKIFNASNFHWVSIKKNPFFYSPNPSETKENKKMPTFVDKSLYFRGI